MSGLYNAVFGRDPGAHLYLGLLNEVQHINVGRFRDAWVEKDADALIIRVHTRNGGGNRPDYENEIESMRAHPWFVRDADDSFDCTYADFYFRVDTQWIQTRWPDDAEAVLRVLLITAQEPVDMSARWQAAIDAIANGPTE